MNRHKKHLLLSLLLAAALTLSAQAQPSPHAEWDTAGHSLGQQASIVIGDQLNVILSVPGAQAVSFPPMEAFSQNDIVPVSQRYDTVRGADGSLLLRQITTVTCFEVGRHALGGLPLQYAAGQGAMQPLAMGDSLRLTVNDYPNVDTTKAEIKDITGTLREPYTFWEIFRWVLLAAVACGLAWLVRCLIQRRKAHKPLLPLKPQAPPVPPRQQALQALETLRQDRLWQQGKTKEYYTQLTDIVRGYLKKRYRVDSTEMTSDQTLDAFAACAGYAADRADLLRQMLRTADMVKFAKAEPQSYEHDRSLTDAVSFVSLEPQPAPADGTAKDSSAKGASTFSQPTEDKEHTS